MFEQFAVWELRDKKKRNGSQPTKEMNERKNNKHVMEFSFYTNDFQWFPLNFQIGYTIVLCVCVCELVSAKKNADITENSLDSFPVSPLFIYKPTQLRKSQTK